MFSFSGGRDSARSSRPQSRNDYDYNFDYNRQYYEWYNQWYAQSMGGAGYPMNAGYFAEMARNQGMPPTHPANSSAGK